jgi:Peptidase_C39 like family
VSAGSTIRAVPLTVSKQENSEWCWAAVTVSVNLVFRPDSTHTQCELAGGVLGRPCCSGGKLSASDPCNVPHELHPVLGRLHLLAADPIVKPLTFDQVRKEIDGGRPVCVLIKWLDNDGRQSNRGHFIAIAGYRVTPSQKQFVSIGDPFYGPSEVDYAIFSSKQGGYRDGRGVWSASFLVANEAAS